MAKKTAKKSTKRGATKTKAAAKRGRGGAKSSKC